MKGVHWLGSSRKDLRDLPASAKAQAGIDIHCLQMGEDPRDWKPMPQVGAGVREIRNRTREGAFRVFYVVEGAHDVYVLHVFQKKTERTSGPDIEKGRARYKLLP